MGSGCRLLGGPAQQDPLVVELLRQLVDRLELVFICLLEHLPLVDAYLLALPLCHEDLRVIALRKVEGAFPAEQLRLVDQFRVLASDFRNQIMGLLGLLLGVVELLMALVPTSSLLAGMLPLTSLFHLLHF